MTDLEMMELAAKASGIDVHRGEQWQSDMLFRAVPRPNSPLVAGVEWNPLRSDADALALVVRMEIDLFVRGGRWTEAVRPMGPLCSEPHHGDPLAATRRAIVRAAVEAAPHVRNDEQWRAKPHQPLPDRRKTPNVNVQP